MQNPATFSEIDITADSRDSGDRFLSQIRLFLAFKKGAGQDTEREEFLLDCVAEMRQNVSRQRTPIEVFSVAHIINPTEI